MMGNTSLSEIRAELRKAYGMTDAELNAKFKDMIAQTEKKPKTAQAAAESLRSLLAELNKEIEAAQPKKRSASKTARSKKSAATAKAGSK